MGCSVCVCVSEHVRVCHRGKMRFQFQSTGFVCLRQCEYTWVSHVSYSEPTYDLFLTPTKYLICLNLIRPQIKINNTPKSYSVIECRIKVCEQALFWKSNQTGSTSKREAYCHWPSCLLFDKLGMRTCCYANKPQSREALKGANCVCIIFYVWRLIFKHIKKLFSGLYVCIWDQVSPLDQSISLLHRIMSQRFSML